MLCLIQMTEILTFTGLRPSVLLNSEMLAIAAWLQQLLHTTLDGTAHDSVAVGGMGELMRSPDDLPCVKSHQSRSRSHFVQQTMSNLRKMVPFSLKGNR